MKFIALHDTLRVMSEHTHYNWCKWAVRDALLDGQLTAYAKAGRVKSYARAASLRLGASNTGNGDRRRWDCVPAEIEKDYGIELADFAELDWDAKLLVCEWEWQEPDAPLNIGIGYHFWGETDWARSTHKLDEYQGDDGWREFFRYDQIVDDGLDLRLVYDVELRGLCLELDEIAAFAPNINFDQLAVDEAAAITKKKGAAGRPRKWDWTGAIVAVVAVAYTPDGLPRGQGAQATAAELVGTLGEIGDTSSDDPFLQWLAPLDRPDADTAARKCRRHELRS